MATIIEFHCLFSHDIKRKGQKRWQDARLKYHAYNKRIVVHDERGNYVGDAYWPGTHGEFVDGEEIMLDRGGVIVQVADKIGRREQDLSELVDKRAKELEERKAKAAASAAARPPRPTDNVQLTMMRRPISEILSLQGQRQQQQQQSTPSSGYGWLGRAVIPKESPYEARLLRQKEEEGWPKLDTPPLSRKRKHSESPPAKRSSHAQALFGTPLTLSARPISSPYVRPTQQPQSMYRPLHDRTNMRVSSLGQKQERQGERDQRWSEKSEQQRTSQQQNRYTKSLKRANVSPPTFEASSDGDDDGPDAQSSNGSVQIVARPLAKQQGSGPSRGRQDTRPAEVTGGGVYKQPTYNSIIQSSFSTARRPLKRRGANPPQQKSTSIWASDEGESEDDEDTPHQLASGGLRTAEAATTAELFVVDPHASVREKDGHQTGKKKQFTAEKAKTAVISQPRTAQTGLPRKQNDAQAAPEPRTELRIRPSKKRGLLIVSEKQPAAPAADAALARDNTNANNTRAAVTSETYHTMSKAAAVAADPAFDKSSNQSFLEWLRANDSDDEALPSSPPSRYSTSEHRPLGKRTEEERRRSHGGELLPGRESRKRKDADSQPHPHHLEKHGQAQKGGTNRRSTNNIPGSARIGSDWLPGVSRGGESSGQEGSEKKKQRREEDSDGLLSRSNVQRTSSSGAGQTSAQAAPHTNIQSRVPVFQPMRTETHASDRESSHAQGIEKQQQQPLQLRPGQGVAGDDPGKDQGHQPSSPDSIIPASYWASLPPGRGRARLSFASKGRGRGVRFVRMPRRHIRSKEVFGLVVPPDDKHPISNQLAMASGIESPKPVERQNQSQAKVLESGQPTPTALAQQQEAKPDRDQGTNEPKRYISNPATRGRKAATKADAAGLPIQSMVPYDPVPPPRPLPLHLGLPPQQQQRQERPERQRRTGP